MGIHLVTGGAGFIGSSLAEALLAKGERVAAAYIFEPRAEPGLNGVSEPLDQSDTIPEAEEYFEEET